MLLQRLKPEIMKCWLILAAWCEKPGAQSFFKAFFEDIVFSKYLSHWSHSQLRPLGFFADLNTGVLGWVPGTREQRSLLWRFWFMSSALYPSRVQWPFAKDGFSSLNHELIFLFFHFINSFISHLPTSLMVKEGVLMTCINRKFTFFSRIWLSSAPSEPSAFQCLHCYKAGGLEVQSEEMMCPSEMESHKKSIIRNSPEFSLSLYS